MNNPISISDARARLPELVNEVSEKYGRAVITVNGRPKAVVISVEEIEALEETAEILAIPGIKKDLAKSREQIEKGEFIPLSELK